MVFNYRQAGGALPILLVASNNFSCAAERDEVVLSRKSADLSSGLKDKDKTGHVCVGTQSIGAIPQETQNIHSKFSSSIQEKGCRDYTGTPEQPHPSRAALL